MLTPNIHVMFRFQISCSVCSFMNIFNIERCVFIFCINNLYSLIINLLYYIFSNFFLWFVVDIVLFWQHISVCFVCACVFVLMHVWVSLLYCEMGSVCFVSSCGLTILKFRHEDTHHKMWNAGIVLSVTVFCFPVCSCCYTIYKHWIGFKMLSKIITVYADF